MYNVCNLAILEKEINCQNSRRFSNNISVMNNNYLFYNTLLAALYNDIKYHIIIIISNIQTASLLMSCIV